MSKSKYLLLLLLCLSHVLGAIDVILLFGPPGSGKGTFSGYAKTKGWGHISAGDLLRDEISNKTDLGLLIEETIKSGGYVQPSITLQLVRAQALYYTKKNQPFIIDGFGCSETDAQALLALLGELGADAQVFFLDADDATCMARVLMRLVCPHCHFVSNLSTGLKEADKCPSCEQSNLAIRINDRPETILKRLTLYRNEIEPCYRSSFAHLPISTVYTDKDLLSCFLAFDTILSRLSPLLLNDD